MSPLCGVKVQSHSHRKPGSLRGGLDTGAVPRQAEPGPAGARGHPAASECCSTRDICPCLLCVPRSPSQPPSATCPLSLPLWHERARPPSNVNSREQSFEEAREKEGEREGLSQQPGLVYVKLPWPQALLRLRELQGNQLSTSPEWLGLLRAVFPPSVPGGYVERCPRACYMERFGSTGSGELKSIS